MMSMLKFNQGLHLRVYLKGKELKETKRLRERMREGAKRRRRDEETKRRRVESERAMERKGDEIFVNLQHLCNLYSIF